MEEVKPISPYIGGKSRLAKTIIPIIESIPHKTYAEPFVGMGGIFLKRKQKTSCEVINDYNKEIANLFRVIKKHKEEFLRCCCYTLNSRQLFEELKSLDVSILTDIERATRFFYLLKCCFGGRMTSISYGVSKERASRFNYNIVKEEVEKLSERLYCVSIESLDFEEFILRYDAEHTLFYLDPPYFGVENVYGKGLFCREDFSRLKDTLDKIKGSFILSINDKNEIRDIFSSYYIKEVQTTYSVSREKVKNKTELIISNKEI